MHDATQNIYDINLAFLLKEKKLLLQKLTLSWLSITPLGSPVVPGYVYMIGEVIIKKGEGWGGGRGGE